MKSTSKLNTFLFFFFSILGFLDKSRTECMTDENSTQPGKPVKEDSPRAGTTWKSRKSHQHLLNTSGLPPLLLKSPRELRRPAGPHRMQPHLMQPLWGTWSPAIISPSNISPISAHLPPENWSLKKPKVAQAIIWILKCIYLCTLSLSLKCLLRSSDLAPCDSAWLSSGTDTVVACGCVSLAISYGVVNTASSQCFSHQTI